MKSKSVRLKSIEVKLKRERKRERNFEEKNKWLETSQEYQSNYQVKNQLILVNQTKNCDKNFVV